jgi:hypothetical protein
MTKSLVAIATAILAATTFLSSAAEAGFRVGIGFGGGVPPYLTDYNKQSASEHKAAKKRYRAARREENAPVRAAKKKSAASTSVAKAEKVETETAPVKTAETENSSISLEQVDVAQKTPADPVQTAEATSSEAPAARQIDCKKFFPSAGLTLTVPCE